MAPKNSLPKAIQTIRKARGLSQEAFSDVSSRTYLSSLERGLKSPTWQKLTQLCEVMDIHPLTLVTLASGGTGAATMDKLFERVRKEIGAIQDS